MSDKALFSVVVLMYNNAEYLEECLKSVFSQSYSSIELIVVDDYSKTFEKEKIIDFIECNKHDNIQSFVVYQNPKNYGTVKSINVALTHCSGEYIKLLAADDSFNDANALDVVANTFIETDCLFVASKVVICDKFMKPIHRGEKKKQININQWDSEKCFKELCKTNIYDTIGIFYSKAFFEVTGSFDESYVLLEDWPKFLMAAKMGFKPYYIDIVQMLEMVPV